MSYLPIEPYLIELLAATDAENCQLVIAGGVGIYLKRRWVAQQMERAERRWLEGFAPPLPDARATDDIDAFLRMELFALPHRATFRGILEGLGYTPIPRAKYYQFSKPKSGAPEHLVKIDLLAPRDMQDGIKSKPPRIGPRDNKLSGDDERLHAHVTPEAFAIEHRVQTLPLEGLDLEGNTYRGKIRVPHPFASLCMKLQAAQDYERTPLAERMPKKNGMKHAFDVYLLTAMLDEEEHQQVEDFVQEFRDRPEMATIQEAIGELFGDPDQPGCLTIKQSGAENLNLEQFCAVLGALFTQA